MRFGRNQLFAAGALLAISAFSCSKGKSGGGGDESTPETKPADPATPAAADPAASTLTLAGSLGLVGVGSGLAGLTEQYIVYAIGFTDDATPPSCKASVSLTSGEFKQDCPGMAGIEIGAFLRQVVNGKEKTVATLEIKIGDEEKGSATLGGGEAKMKIVFNPTTGLATATIDPASPALAKDKLDAALAATGAKKTDIAGITGVYHASCLEKPGFECPPADQQNNDGPGAEFDIYVKHWTSATRGERLSIWQSKERHDKFFPGGGVEDALAYYINVGGDDGKVPVDVSSTEKFRDSMLAVYAKLPAGLQTKIKDHATGSASWLKNQCDQEAQAQSTFKADNCKFVKVEMETYKYFDPERGEEVTNSHPKYYGTDDFAALTNYTGTVSEVSVACDFDPETDTQWCPFGPQEGKTSFTLYTAEGSELRLICEVTDQNSGEKYLNQEPAQGGTLDAAIAAKVGNTSPQCKKVVGGALDGIIAGYADEVVIALASLTQSEGGGDGDGQNRCSRYTIPDSFSFASCSMDNHNAPSVCWSPVVFQKTEFGMKVGANGALVADGDSANIYQDTAATLCPTYYAANKDSWFGQMDQHVQEGDQPPQEGDPQPPQDGGGFVGPNHKGCRDEFLAANTTAKAQAQAISKADAVHMPFADLVLCVETDQTNKDIVSAIQDSSLVPHARFDRMWDEKTATAALALTCDGGNCTDSPRLDGRHVEGALSAGYGGGFSVTETEESTFSTYDDGKAKQCTFAHQFQMQGKRKSENEIEAALTSKETQDCEESEEEGGGEGGAPMALQGDGGEGGGEGGGGGGGGFSMFFKFVRK